MQEKNASGGSRWDWFIERLIGAKYLFFWAVTYFLMLVLPVVLGVSGILWLVVSLSREI
jgi:hypothetical protein